MAENKVGNGEVQGENKEERKLFVGGLSWDTTEQSLKEYFQKFGDIENINIKTDPFTGKSRGFAFLSFTTVEAVNKVLAAGNHVINGKKVDPKKVKQRIGKIFVGGLTPEISNDDIKSYFAKFGNIVDMEMPFDKVKNQRKGFCFISFESEKVANELLKTPKQNINGKQVDVKRVIVKPEMMMSGGMVGVRGGRGGSRGRGRGGRGAGAPMAYDYTGYDQTAYGYEADPYSGYDYYGYDYSGYDYSSYPPPPPPPPPAKYGGYGGGKQRGGMRQLQRVQPY
ncbi:RNA-binding protein squid [Anabrus simplex]|uniref:RNA-binding protein squid n=1 Tax=Anabrus simplex TaxID=316456 RepID=UPI0034DD63EA